MEKTRIWSKNTSGSVIQKKTKRKRISLRFGKTNRWLRTNENCQRSGGEKTLPGNIDDGSKST